MYIFGEEHVQSHIPASARAADNRRGGFSLLYLEESEQYRLRTGFRALAGRSLYRWDEVEPHKADVLVLGAKQPDVRTTAPIKLWIGDEQPGFPSDDVFHLPSTFTTHTLWGVLDLIALQLMDTRRQPVVAEHAPPQSTVAVDDKPTYRLLRWVTLDIQFQEQRFRQAMACMTSRDVSLHWLTEHGELEQDEARLLLRTLNQHGVLEINVRNQTVWPMPQTPVRAERIGVFALIGRWLRGSHHRRHTADDPGHLRHSR